MKALKPILLVLPLLFSGCDQLASKLNQGKTNAKAIGAACRHSGRALEDCYRRNPRAAKADVFEGWKEMNEYMLSKKIEVVPPPPDLPTPPAMLPADAAASETAESNASESSELKTN
ncbi:hypothetical protein [Chitinibacter sp. S2-10]|uniref:hypothetical protein n=1 Tax=Chitinibacter sp. S2-10 TaxID=3373597 RepID=UPI00397736B7